MVVAFGSVGFGLLKLLLLISKNHATLWLQLPLALLSIAQLSYPNHPIWLTHEPAPQICLNRAFSLDNRAFS